MDAVFVFKFLILVVLLHLGQVSSSCHSTNIIPRKNQIFRNPRKDKTTFIGQDHCAHADLRYRQLDGTCNHCLGYGSINRPIKRLLLPHYQDIYGEGGPREHSILGKKYPLPSSRLVSTTLNPDRPKKSKFTLLVMQLGQMVDHDITMAPTPAEKDKSIKCCGIPSRKRSEQCFPIPVPPSDKVFKNCMEFVRSLAAVDEDGYEIKPREQINILTSFLDASAIYGNGRATMKKLRTEDGKGALLKTKTVMGKARLPKDLESDCLRTSNPLSYCQMAGDHRVNEQPGLSSLHLVFHLQHNIIVQSLVKGYLRRHGVSPVPQAVDVYIKNTSLEKKEYLFQEARKIMSGILQKIFYCDWLPLVLGPKLIMKYKLRCDKTSQYDPSIDPRASNAFLTAAFRFGHSLVPNELLVDHKKKRLRDMFNIPDQTIFHFESIVDGLCKSNVSLAFDRFVSKSLTTSLFKTEKKSLDLVALNIQRGRDHGIAPFYYWRQYYRLGHQVRPEQFGSKRLAQMLRNLFRHPKDIDLYSAGLLEKPVRGGIVGETFGHIMAHQFSDIKYGDAYFFTHNNMKPQGFTAAQRKAILGVKVAQIMCSVSDMPLIQINPFLETSQSNPLVFCNDLPPLDLTHWVI